MNIGQYQNTVLSRLERNDQLIITIYQPFHKT